MPQSMPVIRQRYWRTLLPQFLAIALLSAAAWFILPRAEKTLAVLVGSFAYLLWCLVLRWYCVSDHRLGIQAYREKRFEDAISHFHASYQFFSRHTQLDAYRSILFGVSSRNSYRIISLCNMAYCYSQLGNRAKAVELYESVLSEVPDHAAAESALRMLRAVPSPV